jgi:hypothetical protein
MGIAIFIAKPQFPAMSYYRRIQGVRYAADLLDAAERFTQGRGESRISLEEIQALYQMALDGRKITDVERRTLRYIAQRYPFTEKALAWFRDRMQAPPEDEDATESTIVRVLRGEYELGGITWQIGPEEVRRQEARGGTRLFGEALRGAVEAFLHYSQGQLSFSAFIARRDLALPHYPNPADLFKGYLSRSHVFLIPESAEAREALGYDFPDVLDFGQFWLFGLVSPDFPHVQFIAYVHRSQPYQYSKGYFSRKSSLDALIPAVIRQYAGFTRLEWAIDPAEVQRQLALLPEQNFGNSLFAALHGGIFNGESSFSFRDFIRQEIWQDPELPLSHYMRQYIDQGTLHLIPLDYREQAAAGTAAFALPEALSPWFEGDWVFGLEMPRSTHVRFITTTPRENSDGETGWNDGFILDPLPLPERLDYVVREEFRLDGLALIWSADEYAAQQQQFGPDWHHLPGLFRKAVNTVLHDYVTPKSVFSRVAQANLADVNPDHFDDPQEYRAAIRHLIRPLLQTGSIELLPIELPDNNPIDGEPVQDHWLFFVHLPDLSLQGYWVVIPRWPDDLQQSYVYGDW